MSVASKADGAQRGTAPDPHIAELGKLMPARAPTLGKGMADLRCQEIEAYRDGTVVAKHQVAQS